MSSDMIGNAVLALITLLTLFAIVDAFKWGILRLLVPEAKSGSAHMTDDDRVNFSIRESNVPVLFGITSVLAIACVVVAAIWSIEYLMFPLLLTVVSGFFTANEVKKFRRLLQKY